MDRFSAKDKNNWFTNFKNEKMNEADFENFKKIIQSDDFIDMFYELIPLDMLEISIKNSIETQYNNLHKLKSLNNQIGEDITKLTKSKLGAFSTIMG